MVRYWKLEDGTGVRKLENGTGNWLLEAATTTIVSKVFTYKYDITALVFKLFTYLYDVTGTVSKIFSYLYDINDTGSDVLAEQKGTVTSAQLSALNNEVCFLTKTDGPRHYSMYVFIDNMTPGDTIGIKIQIKDPVSDTWKSYDAEHVINYNDIKSETAVFNVFLPARAIRFCLKQKAGALKNYNWALYKAL